jgi:hypothetical protein
MLKPHHQGVGQSWNISENDCREMTSRSSEYISCSKNVPGHSKTGHLNLDILNLHGLQMAVGVIVLWECGNTSGD